MTEPEQSEWVIYSDTRKSYQRRGLRPGRIVAPPPLIAPDRWSHAVVPSAEVTLCGRSIETLYDFSDQVFRHINPYIRCRECDEIAGNPSPL